MVSFKRKKISKFVGLAIATVAISFGVLMSGCPKAEPVGAYDFDPPPVGWSPLRGEDSSLLFKRETPEMGMTVYTTCDRYLSAPLEPLGRDLFIGFTDRKIIEKGKATVSGKEAFYIIEECTFEGRRLKVKAYTFKAKNCIYDLTYFAAPQNYEAGIADFEKFVSGFKVK